MADEIDWDFSDTEVHTESESRRHEDGSESGIIPGAVEELCETALSCSHQASSSGGGTGVINKNYVSLIFFIHSVGTSTTFAHIDCFLCFFCSVACPVLPFAPCLPMGNFASFFHYILCIFVQSADDTLFVGSFHYRLFHSTSWNEKKGIVYGGDFSSPCYSCYP